MGESFKFALHGMYYSLRTQRNMRIHTIAAVVVVIIAFCLGCTRDEIALLVLTAAFVVCTEMMNTAVETAVDLCTTEYHPLAKIAKNVAAGAVLFAAVSAAVIGGIIFLPRLLSLLK